MSFLISTAADRGLVRRRRDAPPTGKERQALEGRVDNSPLPSLSCIDATSLHSSGRGHGRRGPEDSESGPPTVVWGTRSVSRRPDVGVPLLKGRTNKA